MCRGRSAAPGAENKDYERKKGEMDPCATNMVLHVAPSEQVAR